MTMQILPLCTLTYTLIRFRQLRTVVVIVVGSRYGCTDIDAVSSVSL